MDKSSPLQAVTTQGLHKDNAVNTLQHAKFFANCNYNRWITCGLLVDNLWITFARNSKSWIIHKLSTELSTTPCKNHAKCSLYGHRRRRRSKRRANSRRRRTGGVASGVPTRGGGKRRANSR